MSLDATLKGANSNSYVTISEANEYFSDRLGASVWNRIGDEIIDITGASISGEYSATDDHTVITISDVVAPSPSFALGDTIHILTDIEEIDGEYFITKIPSSSSFQFIVSGDFSLVSSISYLERSGGNDKGRSLIMATRYLDQLIYKGEPTTTTQRLSFPRRFLPDPDAASTYIGLELRLRSDYYNQDEIPDRVKFATYELALRLLSDTELLGDPSVRQFNRVAIDGVLSVEFNNNSLTRPLDRNILNFIGPLLDSGSGITAKLLR